MSACVWPSTTGHEHVPFSRTVPLGDSTPALPGETVGLGPEMLKLGSAGISLGFREVFWDHTVMCLLA